MIGIFNNKATKEELTLYNGDYILDSICVECIESEGLNDDYGLEATFFITETMDKKAYDLMEVDSWIKADCEYGVEYYKVTQVRKSSNNKYIYLYLRHITISESLNMWCEDVRPTNLNGNSAINWIFDNAKGTKILNVSSDISTLNTAYYINKNVYESLYTTDNSFLERWGGEVYRRGFNLAINSTVGENRGVSIRSRKNLRGLEIETNLNNLITRIYPVGFNGITIEEKYMDSPLINNYSRIYPKEVKFDDIKVKDENNDEGYDTLLQAQEEMKRRINLMYERDKVDKITATYRVNFVELSRTEEYKDYQILEKTWLGDTINVKDEVLNVDINVRVVKRVYDCLKKARIRTELSNKDTKQKPPSIQDVFDKLDKIPDADNILADAKKQATALINAGLKDSYVVVRPNEILIMDTKDINTATKVWRWNNGGLGYSSTGYYGTFGTAITQDGAIVADFITTGLLNANLIKTGVLQSFNGASWINMENGNFNMANGALSYDGSTMQSIGTFTNVVDGYGTAMERGGLAFATGGENVGGIRSSSFPSNRNINGISIVNSMNGDYIDLGFTNDDLISSGSEFHSMLRISKTINELIGNFKGIQFLSDVRLKRGNTLFVDTEWQEYPHEIFNSVSNKLCFFGEEGISIGYKANNVRNTVFDIAQIEGTNDAKLTFHKDISMNGNNIKLAKDIFNMSGTRYYHDGWCGSIESTAKRISNLNIAYDSGWYAFASGSNAAPCQYGNLLHVRWGSGSNYDSTQMAFELGTGRIWARATSQNGSVWSAWVEK